MIVKCLNCGYEFHGVPVRNKENDNKYCICEKCKGTFDVNENELEFTLINCEGKEIRKMRLFDG